MGTRLRPLTDALPKPLVPIFQKPLITFALDHLIDAGVNSFVINTHRLPELFAAFFARNAYAEHPVTLVHEPDLLETGGGIKNAEPLFASEPFLTLNNEPTDLPKAPKISDFAQRPSLPVAPLPTLYTLHASLDTSMSQKSQNVS